jgi:hypothetical protein
MNRKIILPVVKGKKTFWPPKPLCPVCKKRKVWEPHSMAVLSAGALLMNRREKMGGPSNKMDGYLSLEWHGAHDGGRGRDKEIGCMVDIIRDAAGGQAQLYFCSTLCLRRFLNACVEELEHRMAKERKALKQNDPRYRRIAAP